MNPEGRYDGYDPADWADEPGPDDLPSFGDDDERDPVQTAALSIWTEPTPIRDDAPPFA